MAELSQKCRALIKWATNEHRSLGNRIQNGQAILGAGNKTIALMSDLEQRREALNQVILSVPGLDADHLAALALRLCVRLPEEFAPAEKLFEQADNRDRAARDALIVKIGEAREQASKDALYELIQEAAAFAFQDHDYAFRMWFAEQAA